VGGLGELVRNEKIRKARRAMRGWGIGCG